MILTLLLASYAPAVLIRGGMVIDGTGRAPMRADVLIRGDRIVEVGKLSAHEGMRMIDATGLVVAPGFVDAHSHADFGIEKEPWAKSQLTQGITTAVVGVDGIWNGPVENEFKKLAGYKPAINFAMFSGHGGIRAKVMGEDYKRPAKLEEIERMKSLVDADMKAGAIGLSSGLEYDPGYYADTYELTEVAKSAPHGLYISHMRDEGNKAMDAIEELRSIGEGAGIPAQISHIKLCTKPVWGKAADVLAVMRKNKLTADIYPYTFWQSSMSALTPSREWEKRSIWVSALADVGGPEHVRLTSYSAKASWVGRTIADIAKKERRDPVAIIQEILRETKGEGKKGQESVAVEAMTERDVETFMKDPNVMFSSDGAIGGTHPRGAGSFPRVLGRYVRDRKVISLPEAIRKMTSLPCRTFGFKDRGLVRAGAIADIVVFEAKEIQDHATAAAPTKLSTGMKWVLVGGVPTLENGKFTGGRNGGAVRREQ